MQQQYSAATNSNIQQPPTATFSSHQQQHSAATNSNIQQPPTAIFNSNIQQHFFKFDRQGISFELEHRDIPFGQN